MNRASLRGLFILLGGSIFLFVGIYAAIIVPRYKSLLQDPTASNATEKMRNFLIQKISPNIEQHFTLIDAPEIEGFLKQKAQELVAEDVEIYLVEDDLVNAFALPGGKLIFTSGLLLESKNAAEVLGVLAHELGHLHYRHISRSLLLKLSSATIGAWLSGGNKVAVVLSNISTLSFSREFELQADQFAIEQLERIGVSPIYLADVFQTFLAEEEEARPLWAEFLSTHPDLQERIEIVKGAAIDYELEQGSASSAAPNWGLDWKALQEAL